MSDDRSSPRRLPVVALRALLVAVLFACYAACAPLVVPTMSVRTAGAVPAMAVLMQPVAPARSGRVPDKPSAVQAFALQPAGGEVPVVTLSQGAVASWYGPGFHGRRTANGEVYDQEALTAAHRTLPFGTVLRVTNLSNGRKVEVRINDRGPYIVGRELDLSHGAAAALHMDRAGLARVRIEVLGQAR